MGKPDAESGILEYSRIVRSMVGKRTKGKLQGHAIKMTGITNNTTYHVRSHVIIYQKQPNLFKKRLYNLAGLDR